MSRTVATLAGLLLMFCVSSDGAILWSQPGPVVVCDNGLGKDILHGAIKPQGSNSTSTLYFKFRVDPIADSARKSIADYEAGFVLVEKGEEHLWLGSSRVAWAYCAKNVPKNPKGYADLNSAHPEPGFLWEYIRAGTPRIIVFKVEFFPGRDASITAWLNPELSVGATELNQPTNLVTQFETKATFDEIRLIHRGGVGDGWKFSQMAAATSFEDFITPYFWQRGWFIALVGVSLLIAVAGTVQIFERRRVREQIQKLENERAVAMERTRIARDMHDEVGISLTKISKLTEMMNLPGESEAKNIALREDIANTARDTIQAMDEIVWAINPKNDTLEEMGDYLAYFTEDFLRSTRITCCLELPSRLPDIPVTAEMRHNLFLVVKEALNNAVKHASPGQIKLGVQFAENKLTIEVVDNGKGFNLEGAAASGNGLENMQKRVEAIGGELQLKSEIGHGTTVNLQVSLLKLSTTAKVLTSGERRPVAMVWKTCRNA